MGALTPTPAASAPPPSTARYIVVLKESPQDPESIAEQQGRRLGFNPTHVYDHAISGYVAPMPTRSAALLRTDPTVQFVTVDRVFARMHKQTGTTRCEVITGPRQCVDDWVDRIDAELSSTGSGDGHGSIDINTAVIDSGIDASHPDLDVRGGVDCSSGAPVPVPHPVDRFSHGTLVAGLIAAKDNGIGVVGAAPGTPLWSLGVVDESGEISLSALVCAVDYVTATRQDRDRRNDIAVANISIGGENTDDGHCGLSNADPLHLAICRSVAAGTTYAAAALNDSTDFAQFSPANYEQVLTVTAMADFDGKPGGAEPPICYGVDLGQEYGAADDSVAPFSDYATQPEDRTHTIAAPGVCMTSTAPRVPGTFGYTVADGTSFASPVVAGTVALCMHTRQCPMSDPAATMKRILDDAATYNAAHPAYGFEGDPLRPMPGRYYGFLINAGVY